MQGEDLRSVWSVINQKTSPGSKANVDEALEVISTAKQWGKRTQAGREVSITTLQQCLQALQI